MIVFDLDGTLACPEHRRHFVDPSKRDDCYYFFPATLYQSEGWYYKDVMLMSNPPKPKKFQPYWKSFYEACDKDRPIEPVIRMLISLMFDHEIKIWSGRCESQRKKTLKWLSDNIMDCDSCLRTFDWDSMLKMRPIGDNTSDDELKFNWANDAIILEGKTIDFVFDSDPKSIAMWKRRGVFVFNCLKHGEEF